jgi:hypothetical protein
MIPFLQTQAMRQVGRHANHKIPYIYPKFLWRFGQVRHLSNTNLTQIGNSEEVKAANTMLGIGRSITGIG